MSLIFAQAKGIYLRGERYKKTLTQAKVDDNIVEQCMDKFLENERQKFRDILQIAKQLTDDYKEICNGETTNWMFITVRPKPEITFEELHDKVGKWVSRKCVLEYTLTYEQKDPNGSGEGFHTHIVCKTSHRSKGECLRDAKSTFGSVCAENCIDVKTTRNPETIIENYLVNYISDDGHKEPTKEGDRIWRESMGILPLYKNEYPTLIKSGTE